MVGEHCSHQIQTGMGEHCHSWEGHRMREGPLPFPAGNLLDRRTDQAVSVVAGRTVAAHTAADHTAAGHTAAVHTVADRIVADHTVAARIVQMGPADHTVAVARIGDVVHTEADHRLAVQVHSLRRAAVVFPLTCFASQHSEGSFRGKHLTKFFLSLLIV